MQSVTEYPLLVDRVSSQMSALVSLVGIEGDLLFRGCSYHVASYSQCRHARERMRMSVPGPPIQ